MLLVTINLLLKMKKSVQKLNKEINIYIDKDRDENFNTGIIIPNTASFTYPMSRSQYSNTENTLNY